MFFRCRLAPIFRPVLTVPNLAILTFLKPASWQPPTWWVTSSSIRHWAVTAFSTTDNLWGAKGGVAKQLTPRLDVVLEYSFVEYGLNNGEYNPQCYSGGVVYHFVKR